MKTLLRFVLVTSLVCTLTGISEGKVKPKNFSTTPQRQSPIAIDPAGLPHVAYVGTDYHVYHARFDGRAWQRELISTTEAGDPSMGIDQQGHIHILYSAQNLTDARFDGTAWQQEDLGVSGFGPELQLDADGHPHVLFKTNSTYWYGEYDGASWQFEDTGLRWSWSSDGFVLDENGNAHITYSVNYSGCFYATNKSGSWESTKLAPDDGAAMAIALDQTGNPRVVIGGGGALYYFSYDGSSWTNETMVNFNDADPRIQAIIESHIAMAMDANGRAQVMVPVYLSSADRHVDVSVFVYDDGAGWNGLLVDQKNTGLYPSIALNTNGVAYVTYCGLTTHDRYTKTKWARIALSDLSGVWTNVSVAGSTVTGTLNVTNQGLDKSDKTTAALWLSDDATLDDGDTLLPVTLKIKSLVAGGTIAVPVSFQYAGSLSGKQLIAVVDPAMTTADRNRLDNKIAVSLGP